MSFMIAKGLSKHYGQGEARVEALRGADFAIEQGQFVSVMGPSGSGKSTLLALMGALSTPSQGSYEVDGISVYDLGPDQRADFRREYLGFVFQNFNLINYLTLAQNVMLPLATKKLPRAAKESLALEALERVGLASKAGRLPGQVSGGEQERAAVARALVNQPPILLADEPTGNLDQATTGEVMDLLARLGREGMTIIMVTHSPACAAWASRGLMMQDGVLSQTAEPATLCPPGAGPSLALAGAGI